MITINEIKVFMKEKKITYSTLSKKSGISISTIKDIMRGKTSSPRFDTVEAIISALGLENSQFADKTSNKEKQLLQLFNTLSENGKNLALSNIQGISIGENGVLPNINNFNKN
ncbi:MAG: helix-turn-helix transcriptional regulator [Clostridia bacterium]